MLKDVIKGLLKPEEETAIKAFFKDAAKKGNIYHRYDSNVNDLFNTGNVPFNVPVTPSEPNGLYLARNRRDIGMLRDPFSDIKGYSNMIASLTNPEKELKLLDEDDFLEYIREAHKRADLKLPLAVVERLHNNKVQNYNEALYHLHNADARTTHISPWAEKKRYSQAITDALLKDNYDAVTFKDWVAGQPHLEQTAVVRPGRLFAKTGRTVGFLGATLGLTSSASLPKYFGRYREGE